MRLTSLLQANPHIKDCLIDPGVIANAYRLVSFFDLPQKHIAAAEMIAASIYEHLAKGHSCLPLEKLHNDIWFSGQTNTDHTLELNDTDVDDDGVRGDKDGVSGDKDGVSGEKDGVRGDKDGVRGEKDGVRGEKDGASGDKDGAGQEKVIADDEQDKTYPGIVIAKLPYFTEALAALTSHTASYHLVIEFDAIYIRSYQSLEKRIAGLLKERNKVSLLPSTSGYDSVLHKLQAILPLLFPDGVSNNAQALAVGNACQRTFSIINGGPGTGKTYTAARVLLALKYLTPNVKIALAAPTGKAAQRLGESIQTALEGFSTHETLGPVAQDIPTTPTTVHRLIGTGGHTQFAKYNRQNPLPYDVIMVDEVSMLDLRMTELLLLACKPQARIVWLGDSAQLPSVDVGCVLEDLVGDIHGQTTFLRSKLTADWLSDLTGTAISYASEPDFDHVITLSQNYRSLNHINDMANAILASDASAFTQAYKSAEKISAVSAELVTTVNENKALHWTASDYVDSTRILIKQIANHLFAKIAQQQTIQEAVTLLQGLKILTPNRRGKLGVEGINALVINTLDAKASITEPWFKGLPIIILRNDHPTKLNNGDIGIVWPNEKGELVACFPVSDTEYFAIQRYRLPIFQPVYAMTVHKSQGSEFANVLMVLPEQHNELCHKELLFTGVTRARQNVMLAAKKSVLEKTLCTTQKRDSFLSERIFGGT